MDSREKKEHQKKKKSRFTQRKPELLVENGKMNYDNEVDQSSEDSKKEIDEFHNQEFDTAPDHLKTTYIEEDEKSSLYSKAKRVPKPTKSNKETNHHESKKGQENLSIEEFAHKKLNQILASERNTAVQDTEDQTKVKEENKQNNIFNPIGNQPDWDKKQILVNRKNNESSKSQDISIKQKQPFVDTSSSSSDSSDNEIENDQEPVLGSNDSKISWYKILEKARNRNLDSHELLSELETFYKKEMYVNVYQFTFLIIVAQFYILERRGKEEKFYIPNIDTYKINMEIV